MAGNVIAASVVIVQFLLTTAACGLVYRFYPKALTSSIWWNRIVIAGLLARALAGVALFWISYLQLPIAGSLQMGNGIWFFGEDALGYYDWADQMAGNAGWFVDPPEEWASPLFLRILAAGRVLLGSSMAVALLLNTFCYLVAVKGLALLASRTSPRRGLVALALLTFSPAAFLFSLQPLKEALFFAAFIGFVVAVRDWFDAAEEGFARFRVAQILAALVLYYVIGGIRWYFCFALWGAFIGSSVIAVAHSKNRSRSAAVSVGAIVVLFLCLLLADHRYFKSIGSAVRSLFGTTQTLRMIEKSRHSFTQVPASTTLSPGPRLEGMKHSPALSQYTALFLPRFVFEPLGLVRTGGSRVMWWLVDFATLIFEALLIGTIVWLVRTRRLRETASPTAVLLALQFVALLPLVYVVNNMGTLFRHREMFLLPVALIPVTIQRRDRKDQIDEEPSD